MPRKCFFNEKKYLHKKIIIRIEPDPQHCLKDVLKPLKSKSVPHNQPLWFLRNKFFKCNFSSKARGSSHYEGGVGREGVRIHPRIRREHVAAYHDAPESTCSSVHYVLYSIYRYTCRTLVFAYLFAYI